MHILDASEFTCSTIFFFLRIKDKKRFWSGWICVDGTACTGCCHGVLVAGIIFFSNPVWKRSRLFFIRPFCLDLARGFSIPLSASPTAFMQLWYECFFHRYNHTCAVVNEQIFLFGGCEADGSYYKDIHVLNIGKLLYFGKIFQYIQYVSKDFLILNGVLNFLLLHLELSVLVTHLCDSL